MLEQCKITGFADEISEDCKIQVKVLQQLGISYLELRSVQKKGIADFTYEEAKELQKFLQEQKISVSAIGSPIGKISITEEFEPHFEKLLHVLSLAEIFQTKYIRMFSFYMPEGERASVRNQFQDEVFYRIERMVKAASSRNMILLHENEKGIYGDLAEPCKELFQRFYGESFQGVFDFANFVQCGQDTKQAYDILKSYISYLHIKDALKASGEVVPCGKGDGELSYLLKEFDKTSFRGFLSLEPHLAEFSQFKNLEQQQENKTWSFSSGEEAFCYAYEELKKILLG